MSERIIRPDFPEYIDSTMRAAFVSCPRKFQYEYLLNRRSLGSNIHLTAGKAFAAGCDAARMAYWGHGLSSEDALFEGQKALIANYRDAERFTDENKSLENMIGALDAYFTNWGWSGDHYQPYRRPDGKPALEFSFGIPLEGTVHPVSGQPIIYCGRFDWIAVHQDTGDLYAVDEKTTSQLGATWPNQWKHRAQLTGYVWAGRQYGIDLRGALVRGISILKTKYGHAESLQIRSDAYIERWLIQLRHDIVRMIHSWQDGYFDYNFSDSCTSYSTPCAYTDVCMSGRPLTFLQSNFEHYRWNPLEHRVEELDDEDNIVRIVE